MLSVISREIGEIRPAGLSLPLSSCCQEFQRDGCWPSSYAGTQGDLERYTMCGTDRNPCISLGLASFGILFHERDTLLFKPLLTWVSVKCNQPSPNSDTVMILGTFENMAVISLT